jgi:hypothetical protein
MAAIITIRRGIGQSNEVISAIQQLQGGFGTLMKLNGQRAQMIGSSQTAVCDAFGPATTDDAQVLSDRWAYLVAALTESTHEAYAGLQCVRDFMDAVKLS